MRKSVIFSEPQIKALQASTLSAFVLPIKPQPDENGVTCMPIPPLDWEQIYKAQWEPWHYDTEEGERITTLSPYQVGQRIFVKEKWKAENMKNHDNYEVGFRYNSDNMYISNEHARPYFINSVNNGYCSPVHMPESAARFHLEITSVKAMRCKSASVLDVLGLFDNSTKPNTDWANYIKEKYGTDFWTSNSWLWYNEFKLIQK